MPSVMIAFALGRLKLQASTAAAVGEAENEMLAITGEMCEHYRVIADFAQRPRMGNQFSKKARALKAAKYPQRLVKVNNEYFPSWLGCIFVGLYISSNSHHV